LEGRCVLTRLGGFDALKGASERARGFLVLFRHPAMPLGSALGDLDLFSEDVLLARVAHG
jgi:hypothetical protein